MKLDTAWLESTQGIIATTLARALKDLLTRENISHGTICGLSFGDDPFVLDELRTDIFALRRALKDKQQDYNAQVALTKELRDRITELEVENEKIDDENIKLHFENKHLGVTTQMRWDDRFALRSIVACVNGILERNKE